MSANTRRDWLKKTALTTSGLLLGHIHQSKAKPFNILRGKKPSVLIAGAGVMGCWSAYFLEKQGFEVTICDPYGAGNPRASSGGETRLLRYMYGDDEMYFNMAKRSRELWISEGKKIEKPLFYNSGLLIFSEKEVYDYAEKSKKLYEKAGHNLTRISKNELAKKYPYVNTIDLSHAIYDAEAGYLLAAESCKAIVGHLRNTGIKWIYDSAKPGIYKDGQLQNILLSDGSKLKADHYLFANGPWMTQAFPELLEGKLRVTRQPVFFFGGPAGFASKLEMPFPVWMNRDAQNKERCYGFFNTEQDVFKIAFTQLEETILDPTNGTRDTSSQENEHARYLMEKRFSFMKGAPLLYTKVCQHTDTPDKHFILDKHPTADNLWLLGGGSGHAFKHGPALGEMLSLSLAGKIELKERFGLARISEIAEFSKKHK